MCGSGSDGSTLLVYLLISRYSRDEGESVAIGCGGVTEYVFFIIIFIVIKFGFHQRKRGRGVGMLLLWLEWSGPCM